jgi:DNA replication and repair protein RecF
MTFIESLHLTNFRSYGAVAIDGLKPGLIVLHGPNGAGKTNVLEALSLLSPGRGLRGAKTAEIQKRASDRAQQPWAVAAKVESPFGPANLGTGADPHVERRLVRVNGEAAKGQAALAEYLSCVWLTPQMDRIFLDGASVRRRFLDRLVFAFDPGHAGRLTRYENAMAQRARILREQTNPDPAWLEALESAMAETGIAIAAARADFIRRLRSAGTSADNLFPRAGIGVAGTIDELLSRAPALEVEKLFRYQLRETRPQDAINGGAATGPHRSDFLVNYAERDMPAAQCSTGEQKALLTGIVLAHARLVAAEKGAPPVLLLDEIAAHLDESRRNGLFTLLQALGGQVWMTGTDAALFASIAATAQFFEVRDGKITEAVRARAA